MFALGGVEATKPNHALHQAAAGAIITRPLVKPNHALHQAAAGAIITRPLVNASVRQHMTDWRYGER